MTRKARKSIFFMLLVITHLLLSYYYFGKWWNSSLGTLLIIGICFIIWKKEFLCFAGLKMKVTSVVLTLICAGVIILVTYSFMNHLANYLQVKIEFAGWKNAYHNVFYILNEEIVFGSVMLFSLVKERKVRPIIASLGLALVFSLGHFIFYKWIFIDKGILQISTIATLFFIAIVRNNLILYSGHIGYSWALHFGWMFVMFGCHHINVQNKTGLTELTRFNMYLGSTPMVAISLLLAVVSLLVMLKKHQNY